MIQIAEQERHIHQRDGWGELRHVGRRHDRVIDRNTLVQEGHEVRLVTKLTVKAKIKFDIAFIIFIYQFREPHQRPGVGMFLIKHACATQRD